MMYPNTYSAVLDVIQRRPGISRTDLAAATDLTPAAISKIVANLIALGLVVEEGRASSGGGRPPVRLMINASKCYIVGVDLARSGIRAALVDLNGHVHHRLRQESAMASANDITIDNLLDILRDLLAWARSRQMQVIGVGVGAPGPLSVHQGVLLTPPNFTRWRNVPLKQIVEEAFHVPVWIDNDANACALAERWFGGGRSFDSFIYIAVGTGVGAGVILNGALFRGAHDIAGELGHTTVEAAGPRCSCGNYGCLELYTSAPAIVAVALAALRRGESSAIAELVGGRLEHITIQTIVQAAHAGDRLALRTLDHVARYLSVGLINTINLFDPEAVFLGREVSQAAGELLLEPIRAIVAERAFSTAAERVQILLALLGEDAPVIGAACLVLQELFSAPERILAASSRTRVG